jgi:hypothetical protein
MRRFANGSFQSRLLLVISLAAIGLGVRLAWGPGETLTWAAPGQNPYVQTMPTRPATAEAEPTAEQEPATPPDEDDDDGDGEPAPTPIREPPSPTPSSTTQPGPPPTPGTPSTPGATLPLTESGTPYATAGPSQLDGNPATSTATVVGASEQGSQFISPLPTPSPGIFFSPLSSPSPIPTSTSTRAPSAPTLSATTASPSVEKPDPALAAGPASDQDGSLTWLYALGVGVILIAGGVFLARRGQA